MTITILTSVALGIAIANSIHIILSYIFDAQLKRNNKKVKHNGNKK